MPSLKTAGAALTAIAGLAGLAAAAGKQVLKGPLPAVSGTLRAPGLQAPVTIDRDAWGIPHIAASYTDDLFFANGFVHAQDRFWQIELMRRLGSGRLSELFGESTLEADRLMRFMGLRRIAEQEARGLEGAEQVWLGAYCRGVNHYLTLHRRRLPIEFALLRLMPPPMVRWQPEPYVPADVFTLAKAMSLALSTNLSTELVRLAVTQKVGPERAAALEPWYAREFPTVIPAEEQLGGVAARLAGAFADLYPFLAQAGAGGFSNNWVVDGTRTASGKPLLACDPHLQLQIPSIWYELELNGPGFDVVGASFAGAPGVVLGHNRRIAWGVTNSMYDVQDLVIEQINPRNPRQYRFRGEWREGKMAREEIRVRGRAEPVVEEVLITHHGPVISPALPGEDRALALSWTALEPSNLPRSVLAIDRASNWSEFVDALRFWDVPAQNFVYADIDGNIGYYTPGHVPIRSKGTGILPVPGWTGDYEWTGHVPFEELPHAFNPPTHQIVTANNKLVGDEYPYFLGADWLPGYRAQRISDMLTGNDELTVDAFALMQRDVFSIPGMQAVEVLRGLEGAGDLERRVLAISAQWDGRLTADSAAGCICMMFQHQLHRAVLQPILEDLTELYLGLGPSPMTPTNGCYGRSIPWLYDLVHQRDDTWFERLGVGHLTWNGVLTHALQVTCKVLNEPLGPDPSHWNWGRLNGLMFKHALGVRSPLDRVFNRGPVELGGDDNTVSAAALPLHNPHKIGGWASSYRMIVDLGTLSNSQSMHSVGQSGHVASEHYDDMIAAWCEYRYHPMSLSIGDVRRELGGHLVLSPSDSDDGPRERSS